MLPVGSITAPTIEANRARIETALMCVLSVAAPAPQQQGPTIAGALPAAGQTSPWAGGGRPMTQAGAPVGTYASGRGPVDPNQPALTVGGGPDYEGRPAIRMRQTNPAQTVIQRSGGGRGSRYGSGESGPTRVERREAEKMKANAIETTATDEDRPILKMRPKAGMGERGIDKIRRDLNDVPGTVKSGSGVSTSDPYPGVDTGDDSGGNFWKSY